MPKMSNKPINIDVGDVPQLILIKTARGVVMVDANKVSQIDGVTYDVVAVDGRKVWSVSPLETTHAVIYLSQKNLTDKKEG